MYLCYHVHTGSHTVVRLSENIEGFLNGARGAERDVCIHARTFRPAGIPGRAEYATSARFQTDPRVVLAEQLTSARMTRKSSSSRS